MHLKMLRDVLEARPSPFHSSGGRFGMCVGMYAVDCDL